MKLSRLFKILPPELFVVLLFFPVGKTLSAAAREPGAFETIDVELDVMGSAARGAFEDYWSPSAGARLEIATPFYEGVIRAGGHLFGNDSSFDDVPSFLALWGYLGWSYEWRLPGRFACSAGFQTGVMYMDFDEESVPEARQDETELGFAVDSRLRYGFMHSWSIVVAGEYRVILTDREIEYLSGSAGLSRMFTTPKWLREFFE